MWGWSQIIIAIEGIDGSGKTTQAKVLVKQLELMGYKAIYVRPISLVLNLLLDINEKDCRLISPRRSRTSQINKSQGIRRIMLKPVLGIIGYIYAFFTYLILLSFSLNKVIVCDRYFYQFFYDLFGTFAEVVLRYFPKPTVTFFLNGNIDYLYQHMANPFDASVSRDYYNSVSQLYNRIASNHCFIELNAELNRNLISDIILQRVLNELQRK